MAQLTAETITDEQIREYQEATRAERRDPMLGLFGPGHELSSCADALNPHLHADTRNAARGRVAALINARGAGKESP